VTFDRSCSPGLPRCGAGSAVACRRAGRATGPAAARTRARATALARPPAAAGAWARACARSLLLATLLAAPLAIPVAAQPSYPTDFRDVTVVGALTLPTSIAPLPDGRVLIAEQWNARVRLVVDGQIGATDPVLTVPNVNTSGNERGLLALAVDPAWPARPYLYAYYDFSSGTTRAVYLTRYTGVGDLADASSSNLTFDAASALHLLTTIPDAASNHNGGCLRFAQDGTLFVSNGDDASRCAAQIVNDFRGKILHLEVDQLPAGPGTASLADLVPPGNPFSGQGPIAELVWAIGLRNPFRFHIDPNDGALFIADVGESTQEEWDRVASGGLNLGWPFYEGDFHVTVVSGCTEPGGFVSLPPIRSFDRTALSSASGMSAGIYKSRPGAAKRWPAEYNGDYFYAEYYQGWVVRVKGSGSAWSVAPQVPGQASATNWATGLDSPVDFQIAPDGSWYYLSQLGGELHKIEYTGIVTGVPATSSSFGGLRARFATPPQRKR
jgi:glucose/arabinose dehydrogenase